jgi:hypothetical protein
LLVSLDEDVNLYSSLSAVTQFLHPYRHSGVFLFYPTIFFYPSTWEIPPSTSLQISLGMERSFDEHEYWLGVESYYRTTKNLHEFALDTLTVSGGLSDALLLGDGTVYGGEITVGKRTGDITGILRYGVSWASNRFAELNGGEAFRPRFDRRHELYATLAYSTNESWTVGMVCLLSLNQFPSFGPTRSTASIEPVSQFTGIRGTSESVRYAEPIDLNGGRLPGFQRLEFKVLHRFSWSGLPFQATLRLLNGYGLLDPFVWELSGASDNRLKWRAAFDAPPLLPLYPVVSLAVRF